MKTDRFSRRRALHLIGATAAPWPLSSTATARDAGDEADYYRGKVIHCGVGTAAGAGYDLIARLLARFMTKKINGNPSIVIENIVGAGSLTLLNYLGNNAPRDGTAFGLPLNGVILEKSLQLLSRSGGAARFDTDQMAWIGSPCEEPPVFWVMAKAGVSTFADVVEKKLIAGATQPASDNYAVALLNNRLLNTKLDIVSGYQGTNDLFLAAERGEIQGGCSALSAVRVGRPDWIKSGQVRLIAQYGLDRLAELPDIPTAIELAPDGVTKTMFSVYGSKFQAAYPFILPPGVNAVRVETLRNAFDETMSDPDFAATVLGYGMSFKPFSGRELTALVARVNATPGDVVGRLKKALAV